MSKNKNIKYEDDVTIVLSDDGIKNIDLVDENQLHYKYSEFSSRSNEDSWAKRIIYNETFAAHLICQKPGETNRTHLHKHDDEWWVILKGTIKWWIEGMGVIVAKKGDIVFVPRNKQHKIKTIGNRASFRLAISPPDIPHYHPTVDSAPDDF